MYRPPFKKLETQNKEELLNIIKEIKLRLTELRDIMEHPNYKCTKCPSELTMYKCDRDFLNMAITRYLALGGEYKYDDKELANIEFNEKVEQINKITLTAGGCLSLKDEVEVRFIGDEVRIIFRNEEIVSNYDKASFFKELEDLYIGEWQNEYSPDRFGIYILDGVEWELKIKYYDGTEKEYGGYNAYPYNYKDLLALMGL